MSLMDRRNRGLTYRLPPMAPMPAPQQVRSAQSGRPSASSQGTRIAPVPTPTAEQMPDAGGEGGAGWGRGLGFLVNNPVTRGVLKPLEVLDYPRRLSILGMEQAALALPDWAEAASAVPTLGLGGLMLAVDEDKVREDERSNWEKLKDPEYGFGQVTGETGNKWLDRTIGFAGDVLLDPVTYATFGTGAIAGKAGKATHLAKLTDSIKRAEAMKALGFADDALPKTLRGLGTMDDVAKMGRRGVNIATDPQLRAMGAGKQGLRFQLPFSSRVSAPVPHTGGVARGVNQGLGFVKEQANKLPGMERLRRTRHPIGFLGNDLGPAYERIITGQGDGTIDEALEAIELDNMARRWGSRFRVSASDEVERLSEKLNKMSDGEVQHLIREAEVEGKENILTETARRVRQSAADVGVDLPQLEVGLYAMPHALTREARDRILELMEVQSPQAKLFKQITGITDQDLLQESGFLQKRRFVAGTEIPVGDGRTIKLETGSIDELNEKLGELIPGFKGKLYETDPGAAWRAYLSGVTKDVAKRRAFRDAADRGFSGIFRQGDAPGRLNPYVKEDSFLTKTVGKGDEATEVAIPQFGQQEIDTSGNRFFRYVDDDVETKKISKEIKRAHKDLVKEYDEVGTARREEIADQLDGISDALIHGVRQGLKRAKEQVDYHVRQAESSLLAADDVRQAQQAADAALRQITDDIDALSKMRYGAERTARNRTVSRQAEILSEIQEAVVEATETRRVLETYQETMKNRARAMVEEAPLARRRLMREKVNEELTKLDDRVTHFENRLRNREGELRQNWAKRHGDRMPPTTGQARDADDFLRANGDRLLRYGRLEEVKRQTDRAIVDVRDFRDELRRQIDDITSKTYRSTDDELLLERLYARRQETISEELRLLTRRNNIVEEMSTDVYRRIERNLKIRADRADWDVYRTANMESEQNALGEAIRARNDFIAEAQRAAPPPPQAVRLTADEAEELARAQKYLQKNANARRWVRSEQQVLDAQRMQLDAKRLNEGGLLRQDGRTPDQVRKDARIASKWMEEHPGVGRNVERARRTVRQLEAKQEQVIPAPRQPPRGEFWDRLDQEAINYQRQMEDLPRNLEIIDQGSLPQINQAKRAEAEGRAGLGRVIAGQDPATNEAILQEGRDYFTKNQEISQRRVGLEAARQQQEELLQELDETMSALGAGYRENLTNLRAARAQHDEILSKLQPEGTKRLDYRVRSPEKVGTKPPSKSDLKDVASGQIAPYEAQPLARTVADLRAIIEANPTMDDALMNRIEAQLHTVEQGLANLTETFDIPQREVQRLLDAASKGELQPVMQSVLRDGWKQLWDSGDVVISRELEARYHRVINAMNEPKAMGRLMTAYTNFFKTYATLSPGFHVRNGMSATFMNYSEGVSTATQMRGLHLWRQYAKAKNPQTWLKSQSREVQDAFEATFASGAGGRFFESGVADPGAGAGRLKEAVFSNPLTRASQRVGQDWVEGPVRLGLALDTVQRGQNVTDAINRITRIHFDYSQVSQFDERAKRFIPFWTFMSRNLPMQITQMWSKPRTYQKYNNFLRNFSVTPDEFTPEYILEAGGFDTDLETQDWMPGTVAGLPIFLQPDFAHTRLGEDAEKIENVLSGGNFGQLLSDFNPALTAPIEYTTGRDLFTGRQYQEDDYRKASGVVDSALMPLMAILNQVERGEDGEMYYQEKGFDALRSLIPVLDRTTRLAPTTAGGEMDERQMESVLRFLGAPIRTISDDQRLNERRARYYDRLDERDLQRVLAGG